MTYKRLLSSKLVFLLLLAFLAFLGNLKYQQFKSQKAIDAEKQNLLQQTNALQEKNDELSQSLSYLNSEGFKERVAREQLNLKKEGETVYNISEGPPLKGGSTAPAADRSAHNYEKWWNYFMHND